MSWKCEELEDGTVHVYPLDGDEPDLFHESADLSRRVSVPLEACALCRSGLCTQVEDPDCPRLVVHARSVDA